MQLTKEISFRNRISSRKEIMKETLLLLVCISCVVFVLAGCSTTESIPTTTSGAAPMGNEGGPGKPPGGY